MKLKRTVIILTVISILITSVFALSFSASAENKFKYSDEYKTSVYYTQLQSALENSLDRSAMQRVLAVALSQEGYKNYATAGIDIEQARADGLLWTGKELRNDANLTGNTEYTRWAQRYIMDRDEQSQYLDCDWCAIFVSWCLYQAGYNDDERLKRYYYSYYAEPRIEFDADSWIAAYNFVQKGVYYTEKAHHKLDSYYWNTYYNIDIDPFEIPYEPGGLVFFSWDSSGQWFDHVAIVVDYDKDTHVLTYTNGNSDGQVITREIDLDVEEEFRGQAYAKNSERVMAYVNYDAILPLEEKEITVDTPVVVWDKDSAKGITLTTNSESVIGSVNIDGRYLGSIIESNMLLHEGKLQIGKSELINLPIGEHDMMLVFDDGAVKVKLIVTDVNNEWLVGDVNQDGIVTVSDATLIQQGAIELVNLTQTQRQLADVNNDGYVAVDDATCVQRFVAQMTKKTGETGKPYSVITPVSPDPQIM